MLSATYCDHIKQRDSNYNNILKLDIFVLLKSNMDEMKIEKILLKKLIFIFCVGAFLHSRTRY
jgi:hypothetical protein